MLQCETPERLAEIRAKAVETRRLNKLKETAMPWAEQQQARVREGIAKLWRDFDKAETAVDKLRITQSISKLLEVCLPKAGAYRPNAPKPKSSGGVMPVEE